MTCAQGRRRAAAEQPVAPDFEETSSGVATVLVAEKSFIITAAVKHANDPDSVMLYPIGDDDAAFEWQNA